MEPLLYAAWRSCQIGPPSIVFVSGYGNVDEREMYGLGVQAFLGKPIDREGLIATVERALADRAELWRLPMETAVRHSVQFQVANFSDNALSGGIAMGQGGFSVRYSGAAVRGKTNFECHLLEEDLNLSGQGFVRWLSKEEGMIGIELAYLGDACRPAVLKEISRKRSYAFIPC